MPAAATQVVSSGGISLDVCATTGLDGANGDAAVAASRAVVASGAVALIGFTIAESTGGAEAKVRIRDGASGEVLRAITLAANESRADWFGELPLAVSSGTIYLQVVSGSVEGAVHWA